MGGYERRVIVIAVAITAIIVGVCIGVFSWLSSSDKDEKALAAENAAIVSGMVDATLREWAVDEVCYDAKTKYIFFHIPPHKPIEGMTESGWHAIKSYKFTLLENKSYVMESYGDQFSPSVDTKGLFCKNQAADPNWFKE